MSLFLNINGELIFLSKQTVKHKTNKKYMIGEAKYNSHMTKVFKINCRSNIQKLNLKYFICIYAIFLTLY